MSTIFRTIGVKVKAEETTMVNFRVAQVNTDEAARDAALAAINADKSSKFTSLDGDIASAKAAKEAALATKKAELNSEIAALVTNATEDVDSIGDVISYLNANNADWISTLAAKKTSLDTALVAEIADAGDYATFSGVWG